jgi:hypothetical protein
VGARLAWQAPARLQWLSPGREGALETTGLRLAMSIGRRFWTGQKRRVKLRLKSCLRSGAQPFQIVANVLTPPPHATAKLRSLPRADYHHHSIAKELAG